jgi:hypothetical protein
VGCTPSGDKVPTVYIQTRVKQERVKQEKTKQKQTVLRAGKKIPMCCQIFRRIRRIEKHNSDLPSRADLATENRWSGTHNFYWVSIVHTILPSFTLPQTAPGHKKQKNKNKNKNNPFHVQIKKKIQVGSQTFRRIRRIEKHIPICAAEWISQRKADGL